MASNSFGTHFRITTFGESHGLALGVVIDGCPSGLCVTKEEIDQALLKRRPGNTPWTSPRQEKDEVEILSGLYQGVTTGAPIALLVRNVDAKPEAYAPLEKMLRPGHANFTYLEKYGVFDPKGGGRASGRETLCRVAAGAIAKKLLSHFGISLLAHLKAVGDAQAYHLDLTHREKSPVFCADKENEPKLLAQIAQVMKDSDSIGGLVEAIAWGLPIGLGDPVYEKLEAKLAYAMLSIPATKGFELGEGFAACRMKGSEHNDPFASKAGPASNHAGGTLGGISTGCPLILRVAFKPTSSIKKPQKTVDQDGQPAVLEQPETARHDPCIAVRGVPVVEAMLALVLADCLMHHRSISVITGNQLYIS